MKKAIFAGALAASALMLGGCAAPYSQGTLFSATSAPLGVTNNAASCDQVGTSSMTNILGLFATGDASITAAKQSAGITKVANVDYDYSSILGIINTTTTKVCGE